MSRRGLLSLSVLALIILMVYCTWTRIGQFVKQAPVVAPIAQHIAKAPLAEMPSLEALQVAHTPKYNTFVFEKDTEATTISGLFASQDQLAETFGSSDIARGEIVIDEGLENPQWIGFMQVLVPMAKEKFTHLKATYLARKMTLEGELIDTEAMDEMNMLIANAEFDIDNRLSVVVPPPEPVIEEPVVKEKKEEVNTTVLGLNKLVDIYKEENPEKSVGENSLEELKELVKSTEVLFPYNSTKPHTNQRPAIMRMVQLLEANPEVNLNIIGSTDAKGTSAYNMKLSRQRAEQIVHCIASLGVSKERLHPKWVGKDIEGTNASQQRKVEFSIVSKETVIKEVSSLRVDFSKNSASIKKQDNAKLDRLAAQLKENPSLKLHISGYTDKKGTQAYNLILSEKRAKNVARYLINAGIDKNRIDAKGYGINTKYNNTHDRRVEFKILGE